MIFSALYAVHLSFIIPDAVIEETPVIYEIKSSSSSIFFKRLLSFYDEFTEIHWNDCKNYIFVYFHAKGTKCNPTLTNTL